jgi:hypothetical protein
MKFMDSKTAAFALFLLPGVGVFAQASTGPLGVVVVSGTTLVSDLANPATGALSQAEVITGVNGVTGLGADPRGRFVYLAGGQMLSGYIIDAGDGVLTHTHTGIAVFTRWRDRSAGSGGGSQGTFSLHRIREPLRDRWL